MTFSAEELRTFLGRLRTEYGFTIGVREIGRAELVRSMLSASSASLSPDDWAMHIAPVVCGSSEEQVKLRTVLREYSQNAARLPSLSSLASPPPRETRSSRRTRRHRLWLGLAVLVAVAALLVWWWTRNAPGFSDLIVGGRGPIERRQSPIATNAARQIVSLAVPWVLLGIFFLWRVDRRLAFMRRMARSDSGHSIYRFGSARSRYFEPARVARYLRSFKLRWPRGPQFFAADLTVRAVSEHAGYAEPQFRRHTASPQYVVMIHQRGRNDHASDLGLEIVALLESADVPTATFFYIGYPAQLTRLEAHVGSGPELGLPTTLESVLDDYHGAVVIVVDDGVSLLNPLTLELRAEAATLLSSTRLVAILSPTVTDSWGWRERALDDAGFLVLPCDTSGIVELARMIGDVQRTDVSHVDPLVYAAERRYEREGTTRYPPLLRADADHYLSDLEPEPAQVQSLLDQLKRYLGPSGFTWLASLAAYPVIQPDLTRDIGARLGAAYGRRAFGAQTYLALARLPWTTRGRMPDWLRRALLRSLPEEVVRSTRAALDALLSQPSKVGSVALDITPRRSWWRRLPLVSGRSWQRSLAARDEVFVRFMTTGPHPLLVPAPPWLERLFRPKVARWIVPGAAVIAAVSMSAVLMKLSEVFPEYTMNTIIIAGLAAPAAWHVLRSHMPNDMLSRSGFVLSGAAFTFPILVWAFGIHSATLGDDVFYGWLVVAILFVLAFASRTMLQACFLEDRGRVLLSSPTDMPGTMLLAIAAYLAPLLLFVLVRGAEFLVFPNVARSDAPLFVGLIILFVGGGVLSLVVSGGRLTRARILWSLWISCTLGTTAGALVVIGAALTMSRVFRTPPSDPWGQCLAALVFLVTNATSITVLATRTGIRLPFVGAAYALIPQWAAFAYALVGPSPGPPSYLPYLLSPLVSLPMVWVVWHLTRSRDAWLWPASMTVALSAAAGYVAILAFSTEEGLLTYCAFSSALVVWHAVVLRSGIRWRRAARVVESARPGARSISGPPAG